MIWSCKYEKEFAFSVSNPDNLTVEIQSFLDALKNNDEGEINKYRHAEVFWWNAHSNVVPLSGKPNRIADGINLALISELESLEIDTITIVEDTIKGIFRPHKFYYPNESLGMDGSEYCLDTNYIYLVLQNEKIHDIIQLNFLTEGKEHRQINFSCWYMDESEISSGMPEYVPPTQEELDSMELHKNDYTFIGLD
jgi:hypothetical protein